MTFWAFSSAFCRRDEPHALGLLAQHGGDRQAEPVGLDDALTKFLTSGSVTRSPIAAKASPRDLPIWISESTRANSPAIGPSIVRATWSQRGVEALTRLDADGQHVERVGQALCSCSCRL